MLKITLLLLLHEYDKGYDYLEPLNESIFSKPYKKMLYQTTFKALAFESVGDTLSRNSCFATIEAAIGLYLETHPEDNEAIVDFFMTKVRHVDIDVVIKEIDSLQDNNPEESDFFEGLKGTIKNLAAS